MNQHTGVWGPRGRLATASDAEWQQAGEIIQDDNCNAVIRVWGETGNEGI